MTIAMPVRTENNAPRSLSTAAALLSGPGDGAPTVLAHNRVPTPDRNTRTTPARNPRTGHPDTDGATLPRAGREQPGPVAVTDLTAATIPSAELRTKSELTAGAQQPFRTAYQEGSCRYLLIGADKVGR